MTDLVASVSGYASVFNAPDQRGDIVSPDAFRKHLRVKPQGGVKMLYQHAPGVPVGRWTNFEEDSRGLWVEGEILLSSFHGRECWNLLKGRALDGLSIGFDLMRAEKMGRRNRRIVEADLWEISIVTFPMAPGARLVFVDNEPSQAEPNFVESLAGASLADALWSAASLLSA